MYRAWLLATCAWVTWFGPVPRTANAGGSLLVDDAGTASDGHCQLESWLRMQGNAIGNTAAPSCRLGSLEYDLAVSGYLHGSDGLNLQAGVKRTLRDPGEGTAGFAVSLGTDWQRLGGRLEGVDANFVATIPLGASWTMHANLGAKAQPGRSWQASGGVGFQDVMDAHWTGLGEFYAEVGGYRAMQAGLRRWFGSAISLDLLTGRDRRGGWMTVGFNYAPGS